MSDSRVKVDWFCSALPIPIPCPPQSTVRSEFTNLPYGINGLNAFNKTRTLTSNYSIFQNNAYGVFLSNHENPIILDNEFFIASSTTAHGVYLISSTGYVIENNSFEDLHGNPQSGATGITIRSSGPYYNEIYRNNISKLTYGGRVWGINAHKDKCREIGLKWFCNDFERMWHSDIALMPNSTMSTEQGTCLSPAGNLFSHSSAFINQDHYDLYSGNAALEIAYHPHANSAQYPRLMPLRFSGQISSPNYYKMVACPGSRYDRSSCPVKSTGKPETPIQGPGLTGIMEYPDYLAIASSYANQLASMQAAQSIGLSASSEELDALQAEIRTFWHNLTMTYQWDTLGTITPEQMASLLTTYQPESNERFASAFLGAENASWVSTYAQANASDTNLPVLVDGELPIDIPSYFEGDFFSNLGNTNALNALYIANNAIYNPYDVNPPSFGSNLGKGGGQPQSFDPQRELSRLTVTPNPFTENVKFDFSNYNFTGTNNRLEFYDLLGKKVYVQDLTENQSQTVIQAADLPEGVIIYTLYVNGEPAETGKIVRVK